MADKITLGVVALPDSIAGDIASMPTDDLLDALAYHARLLTGRLATGELDIAASSLALVRVYAQRLTELAQADGTACVRCGADLATVAASVPVGTSPAGQTFACAPACGAPGPAVNDKTAVRVATARCVGCGDPLVPSEARAGYTRCEHCPPAELDAVAAS